MLFEERFNNQYLLGKKSILTKSVLHYSLQCKLLKKILTLNKNILLSEKSDSTLCPLCKLHDTVSTQIFKNATLLLTFKFSSCLEENLELLKLSPHAAFLASLKLIPVLVDHIVSISKFT